MSFKVKLEEAINNSMNDVNSFIWKFSKKDNKPSIKLMDATFEQLDEFEAHCKSMLYSTNKKYPGRYVLLDIIKDFRYKCNVELLLRYMENGNNFADGIGYSRYAYYQKLNELTDTDGNAIPEDQLDNISISAVSPGLPHEFDNISIKSVKDACIDKLGVMNFNHITLSFIYSLGVCPTIEENKELIEKDENGKNRNKIDVLKEKLFISKNIQVMFKQSGLTYNELKSISELKKVSRFSPVKYSNISTSDLLLLRNKILFRFEQEIMSHTEIWETKLSQIEKVKEARGYYDERRETEAEC